MNENELKRNPVLTEWVVKDLNEGMGSTAHTLSASPVHNLQPLHLCMHCRAVPYLRHVPLETDVSYFSSTCAIGRCSEILGCLSLKM